MLIYHECSNMHKVYTRIYKVVGQLMVRQKMSFNKYIILSRKQSGS
jgi:hypothetical protein